MLQIEFTLQEIDKLEYERYHHPDPKVQRKVEVIYLTSQGLQHQQICQLCRISKQTLVTYVKQYQEGGFEQLEKFGYVGQPSKLNQHAPTLKAYFEKYPPRTVAQARQSIKDLTGIERSPTQVQAFMKRIGMKYRMVGHVPGRTADPDKQAEAEQEAFKINRHVLK